MTLNLADSSVQKAIHALEPEDDILPIQKALILMAADGKKPATWQHIASEKWNEGERETRITSERWKRLDAIFAALGLVYASRTRLDDTTFVQPKDGTHQWVELADIFLAKDQACADNLAQSVVEKDHSQTGTLLGFPSSAVQSYVAKNCLPISEWPLFTETVNADAMKFLDHMISKDNWQREIDYLPAFSNRVNAISSKIYRDCTR